MEMTIACRSVYCLPGQLRATSAYLRDGNRFDGHRAAFKRFARRNGWLGVCWWFSGTGDGFFPVLGFLFRSLLGANFSFSFLLATSQSKSARRVRQIGLNMKSRSSLLLLATHSRRAPPRFGSAANKPIGSAAAAKYQNPPQKHQTYNHAARHSENR
jgi:hypothetical protein